MQRTDQVFLFGDQAREAECPGVFACVFSFQGSRLIFRDLNPCVARILTHETDT